MHINLGARRLTLEEVQQTFPTRRWVTSSEVQKGMEVRGSVDRIGRLLGNLGLVRSAVRVGDSIARVWLINGQLGDQDTRESVRNELIEHGYALPKKPKASSRVVRLGASK